MDRVQLRSTLTKLILGCLVVAALVAVVTILIGEFNQTTGRALGTVFSALIHLVVVFGLINMTTPSSDVSRRSSDIVTNIALVIAVLSFFTSVFGIWGLLGSELTGKLYVTYAVMLFVLLHSKALYDVQMICKKLQPYVYVNYAFIALVAFLILGLMYLPDGDKLLGQFYGRLLAASAIVDATLSVVVAVMYRLYVQAHPELQKKHPVQKFGAGRIILIIFFFFVIWPLLRWVL